MTETAKAYELSDEIAALQARVSDLEEALREAIECIEAYVDRDEYDLPSVDVWRRVLGGES